MRQIEELIKLSSIQKQNSIVREFEIARTKNTMKVVKELKLSPYRENRGQTSPETDSAPPPSPPASLFEPGTSAVQLATDGVLKDNEKKRIKKYQNTKEKESKESQSANGGNGGGGGGGGIDLSELDKRDPEMASAVRLMVEEEEKDEGKLKKGKQT